MEGLAPPGWAPRVAGGSQNQPAGGAGPGGMFQHEAAQDSEELRDKDTGQQVRDGDTERSVTVE